MITIGTLSQNIHVNDEILLKNGHLYTVQLVARNGPFVQFKLLRNGESERTWCYLDEVVQKFLSE